MYADYSDYQRQYGIDRLPEADFPLFAVKAARTMDMYTTGVDGVRKLKVAFPSDMETAMLVKICFCEIVDLLYEISRITKEANEARGYVTTADGIRGKVVASRSAGNESISYGTATGSGDIQTAAVKAATDSKEEAVALEAIINKYLSGLQDANGVNLLYLGRYPFPVGA